MTIHWFPGHMAKARRTMQESMKLIDVVIELLDARIPFSSSNPLLAELIGSKPRIIALNKADLADSAVTLKWIEHFLLMDIKALPINSISGKGVKELSAIATHIGLKRQAALMAKGVKPRAVRAMIAGIPNVGKSSLINRMSGQAVTKTADKPGVTRGKQLIKIGRNLELLDTPGILWPRLEDQSSALKLAFSGAISDEAIDIDRVAIKLAEFLWQQYRLRIVERYHLPEESPTEGSELLANIAKKRGFLRTGGIPDREQAGRTLLNEFRAGKLGRMTLDWPESSN